MRLDKNLLWNLVHWSLKEQDKQLFVFNLYFQKSQK